MITGYSNTISVTTLAPSLLLDLYPSAAAAYSLRKLRTAYTGSAIRVRRASDNTEQNIGFVDNELDTSSLTSFCSGTNGFVTTWYDQSGNANNATQTTAANQPQIVSSGSVILENGNACISFQSKFFTIPQISSTTYSLFTVLKITTITNFGGYVMSSGTGAGFKIISLYGKNIFMPYSNNIEQRTNARKNIGVSISTQYLENWIYPDAPAQLYQNATSTNVNNDVSQGWGNGVTRLGSLEYTGAAGGSYEIQEVIIYTSDESSNRTGISDNINSFYSIY